MGTEDEVEAQAVVDELVLRRGELQRAKKDYSEAHKEKDFPKIQEKKRDAKAREENSTAAINRLETRLAKLNTGFESVPWGLLSAAWQTQCPSYASCLPLTYASSFSMETISRTGERKR